ncbi:MAG: hypothetical protein WC510_08100, partial [Candidatus Omnitrophota bacterium]
MSMQRFLWLKTILILLFISCVIYANSLNGDFILDDQTLIVHNEYIKHIRSLPLLFTTQVFKSSTLSMEATCNYYRPVQTLSFALDYFLFGLKPFGYHLTNVLMHSFTAFLVFLFILGFFK